MTKPNRKDRMETVPRPRVPQRSRPLSCSVFSAGGRRYSITIRRPWRFSARPAFPHSRHQLQGQDARFERLRAQDGQRHERCSRNRWYVAFVAQAGEGIPLASRRDASSRSRARTSLADSWSLGFPETFPLLSHGVLEGPAALAVPRFDRPASTGPKRSSVLLSSRFRGCLESSASIRRSCCKRKAGSASHVTRSAWVIRVSK